MNCRKVQQRNLFTVAAGFLLMVIRSIIEKAPRLTVGVGLGCFAFMLTAALLYSYLKKPWLDRMYKAVCLVLCILFYPVYYVIYGGMAGGMIPFFLIGFYIISKLFDKTTRIIVLSLTGILYTVTLLLSHYWWNSYVKMESEASVSAHIWHLTIAGAMLIVMASANADAFRRTKDRLHTAETPDREQSEFALPEDIGQKLSDPKTAPSSALILFTLANGDSMKQQAGFEGYAAVLSGLNAFFRDLSEPGQTVVSYGGDSFVILVENVTAGFAEEYARALVREVRMHGFGEDASVKLKYCSRMTVPGESLADALHAAEQELF